MGSILPGDCFLYFHHSAAGTIKFNGCLNMKTLLNRWFIAGCLTWLIVISMRKLGHSIPIINGYINDAVAIPVIANLGLWFQRVFMIKNNYYVLAPGHIIF